MKKILIPAIALITFTTMSVFATDENTKSHEGNYQKPYINISKEVEKKTREVEKETKKE
jgi:uncharacterized protein YxeA